MSETKPEGLEVSLKRLETIVGELEGGEHTLEQSLEKFEEGLELGKRCRAILDKAEQRVRQLVAVDEEGHTEERELDDEH